MIIAGGYYWGGCRLVHWWWSRECWSEWCNGPHSHCDWVWLVTLSPVQVTTGNSITYLSHTYHTSLTHGSCHRHVLYEYLHWFQLKNIQEHCHFGCSNLQRLGISEDGNTVYSDQQGTFDCAYWLGVRYRHTPSDSYYKEVFRHWQKSIQALWALMPTRALCRIKLLPVTCFGGHVDVTC